MKTKQVWLKGHAGMSHNVPLDAPPQPSLVIIDIGTITILWSQPISALQILSPDGKWRWIKHIDNALVCLLSSYIDRGHYH